ncbi:hypothetical protein ELZ30_15240, partial [Enterococcus faecium]|nr:hypothetical protein [Enterococcus faecium]EGP5278936.1 hypothetical protein [Enterococcus faecium]EGP5312881.1 hypothetical protein [Enterococcus faecium]EGP5331191.1 hypothetical protein [Enterococcus faecium]EGP5430568.1 hypothetical protein [Enterococcus faecium]
WQNMRNYFAICFSNTQVRTLILQPLIHGVPEVASSYFLKLITSGTSSFFIWMDNGHSISLIIFFILSISSSCA